MGEISFRLIMMTLMKRIFSPGSFQQSSLVTLHGKNSLAFPWRGLVLTVYYYVSTDASPTYMLFLWWWLKTDTIQHAKVLALMAKGLIQFWNKNL